MSKFDTPYTENLHICISTYMLSLNTTQYRSKPCCLYWCNTQGLPVMLKLSTKRKPSTKMEIADMILNWFYGLEKNGHRMKE